MDPILLNGIIGVGGLVGGYLIRYLLGGSSTPTPAPVPAPTPIPAPTPSASTGPLVTALLQQLAPQVETLLEQGIQQMLANGVQQVVPVLTKPAAATPTAH